MLYIIFYFQVHQPFRINKYKVFDIKERVDYFDEDLNRYIFNKVSERCYLPANKLFKNLIESSDGRFKISFSITGTFVEQAKRYRPDVFESFLDLVKTEGLNY